MVDRLKILLNAECWSLDLHLYKCRWTQSAHTMPLWLWEVCNWAFSSVEPKTGLGTPPSFWGIIVRTSMFKDHTNPLANFSSVQGICCPCSNWAIGSLRQEWRSRSCDGRTFFVCCSSKWKYFNCQQRKTGCLQSSVYVVVSHVYIYAVWWVSYYASAQRNVAGDVLFLFCSFVRASVCASRNIVNAIYCTFHQTCISDALWDRDEHSQFEVKGQSQGGIKCAGNSTFWAC